MIINDQYDLLFNKSITLFEFASSLVLLLEDICVVIVKIDIEGHNQFTYNFNNYRPLFLGLP